MQGFCGTTCCAFVQFPHVFIEYPLCEAKQCYKYTNVHQLGWKAENIRHVRLIQLFNRNKKQNKRKQVLYLFPIYYFLLSNYTHAQSTFADATAQPTWPKPPPCCPRDLLLIKAIADWLTGCENDRGGWADCMGEGEWVRGVKLSGEISMHTKEV